MPENRHDPTTDVTVQVTGVEARLAAGAVIAVGTVRKEINRLCKESFTRALAWCLYIHANQPKMSVEELYEWLDEIEARSPKKKTWNDYHRGYKYLAQKLVSRTRDVLRKNGIPYNH